MEIMLALIIDNGDVITVRKNSSFPDKEYSTLVEDVDDETRIDVHIEINKSIESNIFSVYSFEKFTAELLSLHCRYSALTDLDEKTISSIQSN